MESTSEMASVPIAPFPSNRNTSANTDPDPDPKSNSSPAPAQAQAQAQDPIPTPSATASPPSNLTRPKHSQSQKPRSQYPPWKPVLILITPSSDILGLWARYRSILLKLHRDCHIMYAWDVDSLNALIELYEDDIAGVVVTDAGIMQGGQCEVLSKRLAELVRAGCCCSSVSAGLGLKDEKGEEKRKEKEEEEEEEEHSHWTVLFAFDFPAGAAHQPLRFAQYMTDVFALQWKISGMTVGKARLRLRRRTLRKMGPGPFLKERYAVRAVVLGMVKLADKVLVVRRGEEDLKIGADGGGCGFGSDSGSGVGLDRDYDRDRDRYGCGCGAECFCDLGSDSDLDADTWFTGRWVSGDFTTERTPERPAELEVVDEKAGEHGIGGGQECEWADDEWTSSDTSTESEEEWKGSQRESGDGGDDSSLQGPTDFPLSALTRLPYRGGYALDQMTEDGSDWVPSDDEGTEADKRIADCPVAIHEVKTWREQDGEEVMVRGYVGFVGHVEDTRSMASLILGMCAVGVRDESPAEMEMDYNMDS
ncbi:hypothetical protein ARAM_007546 [Aspergillus rambellii]|uniref:Uncharacterized protein n=1 Tax=Aspergillus rambellii TaxID=308745 RepID=A0A0F8UV28_9EURO|nr:hypothetical protein ARAM_007546 [Aspergillus rambellii]